MTSYRHGIVSKHNISEDTRLYAVEHDQGVAIGTMDNSNRFTAVVYDPDVAEEFITGLQAVVKDARERMGRDG